MILSLLELLFILWVATGLFNIVVGLLQIVVGLLGALGCLLLASILYILSLFCRLIRV